jgi:hypothetical protein
MAGGVLNVIENLEQKVVNLVEEGVDEIEGKGDKKSVYLETFQGEVLEKYDPYDDDDGDHEVHASESEVSDPANNAEWFPAVKGTGKATPVSAPSSAGGRGTDPGTVKARSKDGATGKDRGAASSSDGDGGDTGTSDVDGGQGAGSDAANASSKNSSNSKNGSKDGATGGQGRGADAASSSNGGGGDTGTSDADGGQGAGPDAANARSKNSSNSRNGAKGNHGRGADAASSSDGVGGDTGTSDADAGQDSDPAAAEETDSQGGAADTVFDKKAPSLIADLNNLTAKGKKAKLQKETLRGVRRILEEPHKIYKDPERLAVARSGDSDNLRHSLKQYGRSVEPNDYSDPQDISADSKKLEDIRANHNKAIRGMIDLGQQYGKDPFDGIDPDDVQDIIEHHAAKHPHRKHNAPYVPPASASDDDGSSSEDSSENDSSGASAGNDSPEDNSGDEGAESPKYPKLDEAKDLDPDNPKDAEGLTHKRKKKKRKYPRPYSNNDTPSDLQLACDSLNEMAAAGSDGERNTDGDDSEDNNAPSDDAPLHKRKAHAAKKLLKCLNRVRSFQQDPASCEGAFVDDASEEGANIAGLSPKEIEQQYYGLKKVSTRYKERMNPQPADTDDDDEDAVGTDSTVDDEDESRSGDNENSDADTAASSVEETGVEGTGYDSNALIHGEGDVGEDETPDIEMALPQNQFPNTVVSTTDTNGQTSDTGDQDSSESEDSTDPVSQIEGMLPGLLSTREVSDVEGAAASIQVVANNIATVEGDISEAESLGSEAKSAVEGVAASIQAVKDKISTVKGDISEAESLESEAKSDVEGAAASIQKAKNNISKVEGDLSEVESLGGKAKSATSKIEGLKGAKAKYSKMINLCSNPVDNVTEAENVLSSVGDLAKNPDAVINQAESLINVGCSGISAITSAKSPKDALTNLMGVATQLNGSGSSITQVESLINVGCSGISAITRAKSPEDALTNLMGVAAQMNVSGSADDDSSDEDGNSPGAGSDSDDPDNAVSPSIASAGNANGGQGSDDTEATPSEFVNAGMYGDE